MRCIDPDNYWSAGAAKLGNFITSAMHRYTAALERRSRVIPKLLHRRIDGIVAAWFGMMILLCIPKLIYAASPVHSLADLAALVLPYLLIATAPLAGFLIAAGSWQKGAAMVQPDFRLSIYGKWRKLSVDDARANPVFGPAGFIASLLIGLLLNVVFRSFEFMLAVPAMNSHAPIWGQQLFHLMAADVIVMSFFYMVCFVMALRNVPLFPRMLLFVWLLDIAAQLIIAQHIGASPGLPHAVGASLQGLLIGNIQKVLISAFVWLPYLILSERVNVTYRQRSAAPR